MIINVLNGILLPIIPSITAMSACPPSSPGNGRILIIPKLTLNIAIKLINAILTSEKRYSVKTEIYSSWPLTNEKDLHCTFFDSIFKSKCFPRYQSLWTQ